MIIYLGYYINVNLDIEVMLFDLYKGYIFK